MRLNKVTQNAAKEQNWGGVVNATVENDVKGGIEESLRNGFRLNWIASDC
ncbi:hypothetical protein A2U01_0070711, partial [Trifolium medium]|nr:hypothetical protein [Trifolium medium]